MWKRRLTFAVVVALIALFAASLVLQPFRDENTTSFEAANDRIFASNDPVARACSLRPEWLLRIWRGYYRHRSADLLLVPQKPNYPGGLEIPGHSGPWDYLQRVPLVVYGKHVKASGAPLETHANITDVYPTVGRVLGLDLPQREGRVLEEGIRKGVPGTPKLVLTIVWDGVGRNVLDRWPDRWPNLRRLEREGTSYLDATVGSSPSITPATHANLGTGAFPRSHGVTAIDYRAKKGEIRGAFSDRDPSMLRLTTFGDEIDLALDNEPKVGMIAWKSWHLGMLGHGAGIPGGDADQLGILGYSENDTSGNPIFYSTPSYLKGFPGLEEHAAAVDRADGRADGRWMGHPLLEIHDSPAWVYYQTDVVLEMLERESYGKDDVPDLFFTNFKMTDIVGHEYTMDSPEMGEVLEAQDAALGEILEYLDQAVSDYVVVVTADHGHTPSSSRSGGWGVQFGELSRDVNAHFDAPEEQPLVDETGSAGLYLNREVMKRLDVDPEEVALFVNDYTIRENWAGDSLPSGYEEKGNENVFSAAFLRSQTREIMRCAFDGDEPLAGLDD